ncbi:MAG: mismatch-specific DNA-glycosylase [Betaproteobacteria bacterium]
MKDHLVPDLLVPNLRLVFCGTAPSKASAAAKAYYAKPGNKFWPSLHDAGITPRRLKPSEYPQLLEMGIGLTDLCKIHCGIDSDLPEDAFDVGAFHRKMKRYAPRVIAFTSKNAAQNALGARVEYGLQETMIGNSQLFVLPSPSGLATRFFDPSIWRDLGKLVAKLPHNK